MSKLQSREVKLRSPKILKLEHIKLSQGHQHLFHCLPPPPCPYLCINLNKIHFSYV